MTLPAIDFTKLPEIDEERLERALSFRAVAMDVAGQYKILNATDPLREPHYVDLVSSDIPRCDCGDHEYRNQLCKHILCALLHENHPVAASALASYLAKRRVRRP